MTPSKWIFPLAALALSLIAGCGLEDEVVFERGLVVYLADQDGDGAVELYVTDFDGVGTVRLSSAAAAGRPVTAFSLSPDQSQVAYLADENVAGQSDLYLVNIDGSGRVKASGNPVAGGGVLSMAWAPDGNSVSYLAHQHSLASSELYLTFSDGTGNRRVSGPIIATQAIVEPAWSPDGAFIAYAVEENGKRFALQVHDLLLGGRNSTVIAAVPPTRGLRSRFEWAPDSTRVAFIADVVTLDHNDLYLAPADGTGEVLVSDGVGPNQDVDEFKWSGDGRFVAYTRYVNGFRLAIHAHDIFGAPLNFIQVSGTVQLNGTIGDYVWAPDNNRLAYISVERAPTEPELFLTSPAGPARLVSGDVGTGGQVVGFKWSPNGSRLAYQSKVFGTTLLPINTVVPDGLRDSVQVSGPLVAGGDILLGDYAWSGDSKRITYRAAQETAGVYELYGTPGDHERDWVKVSGTMATGGDVVQGGFQISGQGQYVFYRADQELDGTVALHRGRVDAHMRDTPVSPAPVAGNDVTGFTVLGAP